MSKTTVSSKFQVVIPKEIREKAGLYEGQELQAHLVEDGGILLSKKMKWPDDYMSSLKDVWAGVDPVEYVRELRGQWED